MLGGRGQRIKKNANKGKENACKICTKPKELVFLPSRFLLCLEDCESRAEIFFRIGKKYLLGEKRICNFAAPIERVGKERRKSGDVQFDILRLFFRVEGGKKFIIQNSEFSIS